MLKKTSRERNELISPNDEGEDSRQELRLDLAASAVGKKGGGEGGGGGGNSLGFHSLLRWMFDRRSVSAGKSGQDPDPEKSRPTIVKLQGEAGRQRATVRRRCTL